MATFNWVGGAGNWNSANHWRAKIGGQLVSGVPGPADIADITGSPTISVTSAIAAGEVLIDGSTTANGVVSYPTISLGLNFSYAGEFDLEMGVLALNGRLLTLTGAANYLNGVVLGPSQVESTSFGPSRLKVTGAAFAAAASSTDPLGDGSLVVAGGAILEDAGSITQEGAIDLFAPSNGGNFSFGELLVDVGAAYTVASGAQIASIAGIFQNHGALTVESGATLALEYPLSTVQGEAYYYGSALYGTVDGAGTLAITNDGWVKIATSHISVATFEVASGGGFYLAVNLKYAGSFQNVSGVNALDGYSLILAGNSNTLNGVFLGGGASTVKVTGAATVAATAIDGKAEFLSGATLQDVGHLTLEGSLYLADYYRNSSSSAGGELLVNAGAKLDVTASAAAIIGGKFVNYGAVTIEAGADLSLGGDPVLQIGFFYYTPADDVLDGSISGPGTLTVYSGSTTVTGALHVGAVDISGGTMTLDTAVGGETFNLQSSGQLVLNDLDIGGANGFSSFISGFGGYDSLVADGFGTGTTFSFHENAAHTGGNLTLTDGTDTINLHFLGDYSTSNFVASVGTSNTTFTFTA